MPLNLSSVFCLRFICCNVLLAPLLFSKSVQRWLKMRVRRVRNSLLYDGNQYVAARVGKRDQSITREICCRPYQREVQPVLEWINLANRRHPNKYLNMVNASSSRSGYMSLYHSTRSPSGPDAFPRLSFWLPRDSHLSKFHPYAFPSDPNSLYLGGTLRDFRVRPDVAACPNFVYLEVLLLCCALCPRGMCFPSASFIPSVTATNGFLRQRRPR